jgi:spermidine synthase
MPSRAPEGSVRLAILVLFFLSGACGLVYEVVWMRMLTLVFGATAFATSTILASFFAGLALGSFSFGRVIDRGRNPLLVYALLEVGIGVFAFLMPVLFAGLSELYVGVSRRFGVDYYELSLLRFVLSFLVLVVPATFMGGTLPVIVKFFARGRERLGWNVGHLYGVNTLGAVVGALSAGFFLILLLGVKEAAYVAGAVNLLIAGIVVALARRREAGAAAAAPPTASELEPEEPGGPIYTSGVARLALWAIGISGFCALALEVFWTRSLVFFLDNSTHAFTTILTAFLLGIALGSFIIARFIDTRTRLLAWFGSIEVLIGVCAVLAIPILNNSTSVFHSMAGASVDATLHWKWMGMRFVKTLAVMLVPTVLMGMTVPLVTKIFTRSVERVGTALGSVYAVNTIGGVFGSVAAGFALIPLIGVQHSIMVVGAISVALGGVLMFAEPSVGYGARIKMVSGVAVLLVVGGAVYATFSRAMYLTSYYEGVDRPRVLSYTEGIGATVKVYRDRLGNKAVSVNGFPVAGTALAAHDAQKPLAHFPMLLNSVPSPRVNIVGFGAGGTSWGITRYDVAKVDCVELVPAVIEAAPWFPEINHDVLADPRFSVILGDGRNYALLTDDEYDVISIDATTPKMAGNGSLYTLEFYELLAERLSSNGLVVQWLPFHLLSDAEMRMIAKTFMTAFPHASLWFSPLRHHSILVGTQQRLEIDFRALRDRLARESIQQELAYFAPETDPIDFLGWFLMGEEALARYVGDARLNTDGHPYLEFTPAMAYFASDMFRIRNMLALREFRESPFPFLVNVGDSDSEIAAVAERVRRRFEATFHSLSGDMYVTLGQPDKAQAEYDRALAIDPAEEIALNPMWRPRR